MTGSQHFTSLTEVSSFEKFQRVVSHRVVVYPWLNPLHIVDDTVGFYRVACSGRRTGLVEQLSELAGLVG